MPVPDSLASDVSLKRLADELLADLNRNAKTRIRTRADGSQRKEVNFDVAKSKHILDEIDTVLARHYDLSPEGVDFIINYDSKYRVESDDA